MQEKIQKNAIEQIQNSTLFREIQTTTMTFIAYLTHFLLISNQSKIRTEFPQAHGDSSQSPYPSHTHTHGNPHTHGSPAPSPCIRTQGRLQSYQRPHTHSTRVITRVLATGPDMKYYPIDLFKVMLL